MRGEAEAPSPGGSVAPFAETETAGSARRLQRKDDETAFVEVNSLIERLHRSKARAGRLGIHDINHFQGLMLFNIGDAQMSVSELTFRGCYLGSNVTFNVKKMIMNGDLTQQRSLHDSLFRTRAATAMLRLAQSLISVRVVVLTVASDHPIVVKDAFFRPRGPAPGATSLPRCEPRCATPRRCCEPAAIAQQEREITPRSGPADRPPAPLVRLICRN